METLARILVVLFLFFFGVRLNAQEATEVPEIPPELNAQMIDLEAQTVELRGLDVIAPVTRAFPTRAETIAYLTDLYSRELPQDEVERSVAFYAALGLLPADIDLRQVYLDLLGSQVAGFYDPDTKTMNVLPLAGESAGVTLSLTDQITYVHEFTHALQDQHFDLNALLPDEIADTPDRGLAITALVEGDATLAMSLYLERVLAANPLAGLQVLAEGAAAGALSLPEGIPPILLTELLFPYEAGLGFVTQILSEGDDYTAVDAVFANPPTTSEQILHPEKYIDRESVVPVDLIPVEPSAIDGLTWTNAWNTTLGEFYLREFLAVLGENAPVEDGPAFTRANAVSAAAGWGGDMFILWRGVDANGGADRLAFQLGIAWDTIEEQDEFNAVVAQIGLLDGCVGVNGGALCMGDDTYSYTYLTFAPDADSARALLTDG